MSSERTIILRADQIDQKIRRIAYQLYELHPNEKELIMVAIANKGTQVAYRLLPILRDISGAKITLLNLEMDKKNPLEDIRIEPAGVDLAGKSVILVDDVLNSGRTLMYAARYVLSQELQRLTTVVLVDRQHRLYPVRADFVGLTLSTTLQDHINVQLGTNPEAVYLE